MFRGVRSAALAMGPAEAESVKGPSHVWRAVDDTVDERQDW